MKTRLIAAIVGAVALATTMSVTPAQALTVDTDRGVVNFVAIYPADPDAASSYKIFTYYSHVNSSESFEGFRIVKTHGPCGILGVEIKHTGYPGQVDDWNHVWIRGVGSTGVQPSSPGWGGYFKSFNVSYRIDTICGKTKWTVAELA